MVGIGNDRDGGENDLSVLGKEWMRNILDFWVVFKSVKLPVV